MQVSIEDITQHTTVANISEPRLIIVTVTYENFTIVFMILISLWSGFLKTRMTKSEITDGNLCGFWDIQHEIIKVYFLRQLHIKKEKQF